MPGPDDPANQHYARHPQVVSSYLLPVLATISALSFMAAAGASIGVWRDVSVMRESMSVLIKDRDQQQKKSDDMDKKLQDHEIRLAKGKL